MRIFGDFDRSRVTDGCAIAFTQRPASGLGGHQPVPKLPLVLSAIFGLGPDSSCEGPELATLA
ncbi:MAG: hypothetical protein EBT05_00995 [Betaproteobacteria bacterium]|nr:hypothetical protein [Betaproteobacteria bacterium]